jgi:hypothetical protein
MFPDDSGKHDLVVDREPKHHVLAGDPETKALFDALAKKDVHHIRAVCRTEHGFPLISSWMPVSAKGRRMSAFTFFNEVDRHRFTLEKVVLDGLEMSLAHVWDFQNDLVVNVDVDVESRSIRVTDIHELMCDGELRNPEGGIDL